MELQDSIRTELIKIEDFITAIGRKPSEIQIMAVTKFQPFISVIAAYQAGIRLFGESRVLEAENKFVQEFPGETELHCIGRLQRNKTKKAALLFSCVQSIDKFETALMLQKESEKLNKTVRILFEFNTSGETTKSGYTSVSNLQRDIEKTLELPNIQVDGLMTIGPNTDKESEIHDAFKMLRNIFEDCRKKFGSKEFHVLSMGMSSDYRIALQEGSTLLRIGTAFFGERKY